MPLAVAYRQGVVYVAEYSGGKISYIARNIFVNNVSMVLKKIYRTLT